jgi:Mn-dependent DtxR family transcriptional regulator
VTRNPGISKIVEEDVLRIVYERGEKTPLETVEDEIKVAHPLVSEALEALAKADLITIQEHFITLTEQGQESARNILKKHFALEEYFARTRSKADAHTAAHILEHYVSREVINNLKKLNTLKMEGVPLTQFGLNKAGMITDVTLSDCKLFERVVSMGIFLGETIVVTNEVLHGIVVKTKNKKFALGRNVAKEIIAVEYEKP